MPKRVVITNSARLHFNSLKMNAAGGRGCGGFGVSLSEPVMKIEFSRSAKLIVSGGNDHLRQKIRVFAGDVLDYLGIKQGVQIKIIKYFPNQVGLGSETQLGLSVGKGLSLLFNKKLTQAQAAKITKCSGVSGVGYYAFSKGGFVVDGGYKIGKNEEKKNFADHCPTPPPLITRCSFPSSWKILLITPKKTTTKISCLDEGKFFTKHTPIPMNEVGTICTEVLMGMVPSLEEGDYFRFLDFFSKVNYIGTKKIEFELNKEYFALFNGILSDLLANKLSRKKESCYCWQKNGASADWQDKYPKNKIPFLSLSSLGPTFFALLLDGYHDIKYIYREVGRRLPAGWNVFLTEVNNKSAKIEVF